jgi:nicotinamidase-related amidase
LRQAGVQTLLFTGVNTDRCVFSTLQDAGFLGYDCILLNDACSSSSPAYVSRAIHFMVQQLHGFNASVGAVRAALAELSSTAEQPT